MRSGYKIWVDFFKLFGHFFGILIGIALYFSTKQQLILVGTAFYAAGLVVVSLKHKDTESLKNRIFILQIIASMAAVVAYFEAQFIAMIYLVSLVAWSYATFKWFLRFNPPMEEIKQRFGEKFPLINLKDANGAPQKIEELLQKPALFVFFRGNKCFYCMQQVKDLNEVRSAFSARGVGLFFVSIQNTLETKITQDRFPELVILSDDQGDLVDALGLRQEHGLGLIQELQGSPSDASFPTYLITDSFGRIADWEIEDRYNIRHEPDYLFAKIDQVLEKDRLNVELQKQFLELKDSNSKLSDLFEEKNNLIRLVTHDLNNSLSIILGSSEIGVSLPPEAADKNRKFWQRTHNAAKIQQEILTQVKSIEALESGKVQLELKPVRIQEVIEKARFLFKDKLERKKLILNVQISNPEAEFLAEPVSFGTSVFNNLLSNAIKFSRDGDSIDVGLQIKDESKVQLTVKDHGIGMPQEILENLFRADKPTSRLGTAGEKGTGFGMPLVKSFVEKYGGLIAVTSKDEKTHPDDCGTTFILELKRAQI